MNIGKELKEHRETRTLSQSEIARRTNIKQENISRWENNQNIPNILDCIKLADYYQISLDELVGRLSYSTGNVEIIGEQINQKEKQLLQNFRQLDKDGQTAFLDIANNISKMYKQTKSNIS